MFFLIKLYLNWKITQDNRLKKNEVNNINTIAKLIFKLRVKNSKTYLNLLDYM